MGNVGIYKITSPSNKVYIGQSWNIKKRFENYRCLDTKHQPKLHNSLLKYGVKSHEFKIISELPKDITQEVMDIYEYVYMRQYRDCSIELLNTKEAGSNGKHSAETREKLKIATAATQYKIGQIPWMQGKKHSEETKIIMLEAAKKGGSVKGIRHTDEAKLKISQSKKGKPSTNRTKVICSKDGTIYMSIKEAANAINIPNSTLQGYLSGFRKNKTALKYYNNGG